MDAMVNSWMNKCTKYVTRAQMGYGRVHDVRQKVQQQQRPALDVQRVLSTERFRSRRPSTRSMMREMEDKLLLGTPVTDLERKVTELGEKAFRGRQIYQHLIQGVDSIDGMTSLSLGLRTKLKDSGFQVGRSKVHSKSVAADGTVKLLLELHDGLIVETVGIPVDDADKKRLTVCVSSQVGCAMACTFCATGKGGFSRNLTRNEIVDQVIHIRDIFGERVSNIVYMGMGEPLANLDSVVASQKFLNKGLGIGQRHITISTVGVPNAIQKLAQHKLQSILAVSLHAPNQQLREELVPTARTYPIEALLSDCQHYFDVTSRRVSFEYILLDQINDGLHHAKELAELLKSFGLASHVNLIPYNWIDDSDFKRPSRNRVVAFERSLRNKGIPVSVRRTRGSDSSAACGQLRNQFQKNPLLKQVQ